MTDDAAGWNDELAGLFEDHRVNAGLAWAVVALFVVDAASEFALGEVPSALFAVFVAVLAVLPPIAFRNPRIMLPWEVLALAALPLFGRLFATVPVTEALATYLAVAAVALVVAVELHVFTMAAAGFWAIIQWAVFGPGFVESNEALMIEFIYSILAGVLAAGVFEFYVRRTANVDRLPPGVRVR